MLRFSKWQLSYQFFKLESLDGPDGSAAVVLKLEEFTEPKLSQHNSFGVFNLRYLMWSLCYFYYCR